MRLAICDDNELERRILHSLLKKYFSEASINCEFTLYDRGTTLYYDIMDGMEFDIIFSFGASIQKVTDRILNELAAQLAKLLPDKG